MSELTVRERILRQIVADFGAMGTDYPFEWSYITRADMDSRAQGKLYTLAVLDVTETKVKNIGFTECDLTVQMQWTGSFNAGDDPSTEANEVIGAIQRKFRENWTLVEDGTGTQLAVNVRETGNTIEIADARDRIIAGQVVLSIVYRHHPDDPRDPNPC